MVKWGIIGCGGIARRRVVPALPECIRSKVVAVMDVDRSVTDEVASQIGANAYYTEQSLLADPEVQAVYIATPVYLHHKQAIEAAKSGKHLLVEKPLAIDSVRAAEIVSACKEAGVYLTEGYMMKHHALNVKAREMVQDGNLGDVVFARAQLSCWYPEITGAWRQDPKLGGGGALMDMATHCYDLLQHIIGSRISEVFAYTGNLTFGYPVDDSSTTLLRFANGAQAVIDSFYCVPDSAAFSRLEIYGNKGSILAEGTIGQMPTGKMVANISDSAKAYDSQQEKSSLDVTGREIDYLQVNMYAQELDYLSGCIETGNPPAMSTGEEGLFVIKVAEAAYESARTGRKVAAQP